MSDSREKLDRIALIGSMVERATLGRTALMKCLFFLKVVRRVPLPYSFGLYTYGPFDSDVLDDLQYAEALGAVKGVLREYPRARGYEYRPGENLFEIKAQAGEFLSKYEPSIKWVIEEFGRRSAIDLEMASTVIYIDRVNNQRKIEGTITEIVSKVQKVKPHLGLDSIRREALTLKEKGLLLAAR